MVTKISIIKSLTDEDYKEICSKFKSASEYLRSIHCSGKGQYISTINTRRKELGLEWYKEPQLLYTCPVCRNQFKPGKKEQVTCSYACSNKYFRSGENNGNYTGTNYRSICFNYHEKKCIICGEDKIVEVHHYDENRNNNSPENLIPICPTHHAYVHSRWNEIVQPIIDEYRNDFMPRASQNDT